MLKRPSDNLHLQKKQKKVVQRNILEYPFYKKRLKFLATKYKYIF